jgi:hypothetical protein
MEKEVKIEVLRHNLVSPKDILLFSVVIAA